jgi:aminoglycoside phosphotransferase (APT) family kinase protein
MPLPPMHENQVPIDEALVRRLLAEQLPGEADLPLAAVESSGTVNALYRLGRDRVVRLPLVDHDPGEIARDRTWLPRLAPHLPLAVPEVLAVGEPASGYPWPWAVYRWLDGADATHAPLRDEVEAARDLAAFVLALRRVDTTGGPRPGPPNYGRGAPLLPFDAPVRRSLAQLDEIGGLVDTGAAAAAWDAAVGAAVWTGAPVWVHGDLMPGNLLVVDGRITAVIDWGALGVGDPACDLMPAWNLFSAEGRQAYRTALDVDAAAWQRGRGWALLQAVMALPYYLDTNPGMVAVARRTLAEVLSEPPPS